MIIITNCKIEEFRKKIAHKKVFCFGSGKYFKDFVTRNSEIQVEGVIDNYCQEKSIVIEGKEYLLYSMSDFYNIYSENCVLIITVRAFEEVLEQLKEVKLLNDMPCFFSILLDDYYIKREEQRIILENQIKKLSENNVAYIQENHKLGKKNNYQVWEYCENLNIGGIKARIDICEVLCDCGYIIKKMHYIGKQQNNWKYQQAIQDWKCLSARIDNEAILFMQHPTLMETKLSKQLFQQMKYEKHVRFIIMVHEVESLRKQYDSEYRKEEFETILSIGDVFIVHNDDFSSF